MEKAEQLKRPTEDLLVTDKAAFPMLDKLPWVKLPAWTFADLLMIVQFTWSFQEFLELETAPSLPQIYCSLFGNGGESLTALFVQFLKAALYDPGSNAVTLSGISSWCSAAATVVVW